MLVTPWTAMKSECASVPSTLSLHTSLLWVSSVLTIDCIIIENHFYLHVMHLVICVMLTYSSLLHDIGSLCACSSLLLSGHSKNCLVYLLFRNSMYFKCMNHGMVLWSHVGNIFTLYFYHSRFSNVNTIYPVGHVFSCSFFFCPMLAGIFFFSFEV